MIILLLPERVLGLDLRLLEDDRSHLSFHHYFTSLAHRFGIFEPSFGQITAEVITTDNTLGFASVLFQTGPSMPTALRKRLGLPLVIAIIHKECLGQGGLVQTLDHY